MTKVPVIFGQILVIVLALAFLEVAVQGQKIDKPAALKDFSSYDLGPVLKTVSYTFGDTSASDCTESGKEDYCKTKGGTWSAKKGTYADSAHPVVICICKGTTPSLDSITFDQAFTAISKVPTFLRDVTIAYGYIYDANTHAGTIYERSYMYVSPENFAGLTDVHIHESAHTYDAVKGGLSSTPAWSGAIAADKCVPDNYA